ncbi:hypothetical protein BCR37DRAFT_33318 [Protomyces lactucae-debilis]|uniref:Uncharacterized protein n=1 Tax=Protomyces lactucae-debilis TaxID=2754530 RepID=A0A1Y2FEN7_PROLT|nr:uncharacterized protein BCR37DRAFT_33318 [Protomyces lactucae-debilis]ORY82067.1 hypothetical protein BCR37DRAFT_33318 [Protomyces lactucae-debilis]
MAALSSSSVDSSRHVSSLSIASSLPEAEDDTANGSVTVPARQPLPARHPSYTSILAKRGFSTEPVPAAHASPPIGSSRFSNLPPSLTRAASTATTASILEEWKTARASSPRSPASDSDEPTNPARSSTETARYGHPQDTRALEESKRRSLAVPAREASGSRRSNVSRTPEPIAEWLQDERTPQPTQRTRYFDRRETDTASVASAARTDAGLWDEVDALRFRLRRLEYSHVRAPSVASSSRHSRSDWASRLEHSPGERESSTVLLRRYLQRLRSLQTTDDVHVALDLAATDVLALAAMPLADSAAVRVQGLCRALTTLCAGHLAEHGGPSPRPRREPSILQERLSRRATMGHSRPASSLSGISRYESGGRSGSDLRSSTGSIRSSFQSRLLDDEQGQRPHRYSSLGDRLGNGSRHLETRERLQYESTPERGEYRRSPITRADLSARYRRGESESPRGPESVYGRERSVV